MASQGRPAVSNTLVLHGELRHKFGEEFPLFVRDPAEAIRALSSQLPGFERAIRRGNWHVVREFPDGEFGLDLSLLHLGMAQTRIHLIPAVEGGAGDGKGEAKLVIGIAAIAASVFIPVIGGAALTAAWSTHIVGAVTYGALGLAGIALATSGAAMMIAPQVADTSTGAADQKNSFVFSGPTNPSGQGLAVPIIIGRVRVGAIPVATKIVTNEFGIGVGGTFDSVPVIAVVGALPSSSQEGTIAIQVSANYEPAEWKNNAWQQDATWNAGIKKWVMPNGRDVLIDGQSQTQGVASPVGTLIVRPQRKTVEMVTDTGLVVVASFANSSTVGGSGGGLGNGGTVQQPE